MCNVGVITTSDELHSISNRLQIALTHVTLKFSIFYFIITSNSLS